MEESILPMNYWVREIVAGSLGGASGILVGHPLDLIKVHQQNRHSSTSALSLFAQLCKEGPLSLYRGVVPPLLNGVVYQSTMFPSYRLGLYLLHKPEGRAETVLESTIAGTFAGLVSTIGTSPLEVAKIKLQLDPSAGAGHTGATTRQLLRLFKQGGLYKGWMALAWRDGPGTGVYMATYQELKSIGNAWTSSPRLVEFMAGGTAGVVCWLSILPFDTVKTRLQLDAGFNRPIYNYRGLFDGIRKMAAAEGVGSLFSGWRPLCARAFPANAVTFLVYEHSVRAL